MRHGTKRAFVALALSLVAGGGGLVAAPAWAHEGGSGGSAEDAAAHAEQDLAGVPMSTIEARTAARRAKLAGRSADAEAPSAAPSAAGDAGTLGAWSPVIPTDVVPVFTAVLPNGKVLIWDSVGDQGVDAYADHSFTRALVWDPVTNTSRRTDLAGSNIFCAGFVQLPDGNVLVVGGNLDADQRGIRRTHVFDWRTETWSRGPDMAAERWYPSVAALGNGEALIVAGGTATAEVYQLDGTLRPLTGFASFAYREYPFLVPRLDGQVEVVGPSEYIDRYDTAGSGSSTRTGIRDDVYRNYGSYATYDYGRTLVAGGGPVDPDGTVRATATAVVVDTTGVDTRFQATAPMSTPRRMHNLTVLADGSVLATGGMNSPTQPLVDLANAVRQAELWNPATGTWRSLASAARVREYHATATLLPDGRVMTGGGGVCGDCVRAGYLEKNVEYFSPPYLFTSAGTPATRPALTGAPAAVQYGEPISFSSSSAAAISKVSLVRFGADTHSVDQGQRYLPLSFTRNGSTITAATPGNGNVAPPGYYMMFAVTTAGVPSVASIVHVGPLLSRPTGPPAGVIDPVSVPPTAPPTSTPAPSTPTTLAPPRCLEVRGGGRRTKSAIVRWSCTRGPNQAWKRRGADATLRTAGGCLTFGRGGRLTPGTAVLLAPCTGGRLQATTTPRGTIRPAAAPDLCVSSRGRSLTLGAKLVLKPCRAGSTTQTWTWRA